MFGDAISQQSLFNALKHASIPTETVASLPPGTETAQALLTRLHGDTCRQRAAWQNRKPIEPDPSRTLKIWETICELDEIHDTCTVDSDSNYESDGENEHTRSEHLLVSAPIDSMGTRASLRSATKTTPTSIPPSVDCEGKEEETPLTAPTVEAGKKLTLPSRTDLINAQAEVSEWKALRLYKLHQTPSSNGKIRAWINSNEANYECDEDGLLWRLCYRDSTARLEPLRQVIVPPSLQEAVMASMHNSGEGAHALHWRMYHKTRERFWWNSMRADIQKYIALCPLCQLHGASQRKSPITGRPTATRAGHTWQCDLLHIKTSANGFAYVLVCVDVFSRYAELVPLRSTKDGGAPNSIMTAQAFMNSVVQHWETPSLLISDGGPEFRLHCETMCTGLRVNHHLGTPHHSAGHGMVEKLNCTVTETLAKLVDDEDSTWETMIPWAQLAYNASPHSSLADSTGTAVSPAEVHTGTRLNVALDSQWGADVAIAGHTRTAQDALAAANWAEQQRTKYHTSMDVSSTQHRLRLRSFELGDLVALQYPNFDKLPQKSKEKYSGPYVVIGTPGTTSGSYTLQRRAGGARTFLAHVNRLKRYRERSEAATFAAQASRATSRRYEVARILDHRMTTNGPEYQVLWEP